MRWIPLIAAAFAIVERLYNVTAYLLKKAYRSKGLDHSKFIHVFGNLDALCIQSVRKKREVLRVRKTDRGNSYSTTSGELGHYRRIVQELWIGFDAQAYMIDAKARVY